MKLHIRLQGKSRYSFRLRVLDRYLDAGDSFETEEEAAVSADMAKHFFREYYFIDLDRSLDPEEFNTLAHRLSVDLSSRQSVESALSPGVVRFLREFRDALDAHAEAKRPYLREWEVLQFDDALNHNPALREWVNKCSLADIKSTAFERVNGEYILTLLGSIVGRLEECDGPAARAVKMHEKTDDLELIALREKFRLLQAHISDTASYVRQLRDEHRVRRIEVANALPALEANRPSLI